MRVNAEARNEALRAMIDAKPAVPTPDTALAASALIARAQSPEQVLALQRTAGNCAVTGLLSGTADRTLARGKKSKKKGHSHDKHVKHKHVDIGSSKMRFFRRLQLAHGGSRNIAMVKLTLKKSSAKLPGPKVLYILAQSLGMGKLKLNLEGETVMNQDGSARKRGHSEAVLRAVREIGVVDVGEQQIQLSHYDFKYASSTNQACGDRPGSENCREESVPHLNVDTFFYANAYEGGEDAGGTEQLNNEFQREVQDGEAQSESESEDEYEAVVTRSEQMRGLDVGEDKPKSVQTTQFGAYVKSGGHFVPEGEKSSKRRWRDNYGDDLERVVKKPRKTPKKKKK